MARDVNLEAWDIVRVALKKDWDWAIDLIAQGKGYDTPPDWLLAVVERIGDLPPALLVAIAEGERRWWEIF